MHLDSSEVRTDHPHIVAETEEDIERIIHYANVEGRDPFYRPEVYKARPLPLVIGRSVTRNVIDGLREVALNSEDAEKARSATDCLVNELGFSVKLERVA